jgi:hypothetical protein
MKLQDNHYLMQNGTDRQLYRSEPALWRRVALDWATVPATIRIEICEALKFHYPLWVWGNESGFGLWTMSRMGARLAFHVGEPPALSRMLLTVKICDENESERHHWNNERPSKRNRAWLREKVTRSAFEQMEASGAVTRRWIHSLVNEIYLLRQD